MVSLTGRRKIQGSVSWRLSTAEGVSSSDASADEKGEGVLGRRARWSWSMLAAASRGSQGSAGQEDPQSPYWGTGTFLVAGGGAGLDANSLENGFMIGS